MFSILLELEGILKHFCASINNPLKSWLSLPHKSPLLQTKGISEPSKVPQVQLSVMLDL